jgi:hypothetical protein
MAFVALRAATDIDPDNARKVAREIVGSSRAAPANPPRPLRGVLEWIGNRLATIGDALGPAASFFGSMWGLVILAFAVGALAMWIARGIARRRSAAGESRPSRGPARTRAEDAADPASLERAADAAEARGDLEFALRLRFRAGLLRLDAIGAIRFRPSITTRQVAHDLRSARFEELAMTFDGIAYGHHPARTLDLDTARETWPRVVAEARSQ